MQMFKKLTDTPIIWETRNSFSISAVIISAWPQWFTAAGVSGLAPAQPVEVGTEPGELGLRLVGTGHCGVREGEDLPADERRRAEELLHRLEGPIVHVL